MNIEYLHNIISNHCLLCFSMDVFNEILEYINTTTSCLSCRNCMSINCIVQSILFDTHKKQCLWVII